MREEREPLRWFRAKINLVKWIVYPHNEQRDADVFGVLSATMKKKRIHIKRLQQRDNKYIPTNKWAPKSLDSTNSMAVIISM